MEVPPITTRISKEAAQYALGKMADFQGEVKDQFIYMVCVRDLRAYVAQVEGESAAAMERLDRIESKINALLMLNGVKWE